MRTFSTKELSTIRLDQLDEGQCKELFSARADVQVVSHRFGSNGERRALVFYCEGITDSHSINQYVIPHFQQIMSEPDGKKPKQLNEAGWQIAKLATNPSLTELTELLFKGRLVVWMPMEKSAFAIDIAKPPQRSTEESTFEVSVKGPRDGFTEDITTNVALIRKRLRSYTLAHEKFTIGSISQTSVSLLYLDSIANPDWVKQARERLQAISTDFLSNSQQLEEHVTGKPYTLFPLVDYIGRPDFVVNALEQGRITILIDGSPLALIIPANFTLTINSPEDAHFPYYFVVFQRLTRLIGLFIAILLPGFWIAISAYNMSQLPMALLATISLSRIGLPLPVTLEAFLVLGLFEVFREAGVRLPKAVGQTVAVVGGLIIGETAIIAGFISPTMLVVTSISAVSTFLLTNQTMSGTVSLLRIFVLLCASFLGMFGFFLSFFAIVLYLARLKSFGLPYLSPYAPIRFKDLLRSLGGIPRSLIERKPGMLRGRRSP